MIQEKIDNKLLIQAIKVLRQLNENHNRNPKRKSLLEDENEPAVFLQFTIKKIPKCKNIKMIKVNLPHSLFKETKEACLITGDLDKKNHKAEIEPDVLHYKELLKKHGIDNVSEVVTLRQLRTEYKPYEAKQKLLAAYDVFLADRKIAECLPRILGRHFFKKRKFPIQITLNTPNLKQQVDKGLATKVFYLTGHGNSCNSEVAYLDMSDQEISENVLEMTKSVCDKLPGSWNNIMGIYLKTALSKAIPVYMSYDDPNDEIHLEDEPVDNSFEIDELSTCPNELVKVYKDGRVRTVRVKRMAQTETSEIADISGESVVKKKKKKENVIESSELSDSNNLATAECNEDSSKTKKKSKKKYEENILQQETDEYKCIMEEKEDSKIKRKLKQKKKLEEPILQLETDRNVCSIEEKGESDKINKKSRNMRKSLGNTLIREDHENVMDTKQKGESDKINKKSRSMRKSLGNTLIREDHENVMDTKQKGKLRKRKSVV